MKNDPKSKRTTGIRFKICLLASLVLMLWLHYDTYRGHNKSVDFAYACDDFGYLRQARLFQQNGLIGGLNTALTDENTVYLIEKFKNLADPSDWAHAVGPHCHNYKAPTDRVVLQYPPLTGLFLSLFFEGAQVRRDLALVEVILVAFLSFIAINSRVPTVPLLAAALGAFLLVGLKGYGWSLSIVGSTLLLTFLGYLTVSISNASTRRGRMAAGFLLGLVLGLSVGFRIANVLFASGLIAVLGIDLIRRPTLGNASSLLSAAVGFVGGVAPVLAANAINTGSPFVSTYGLVDATPVHWAAETMRSGLHYYFVVEPKAGGYVIVSAATVAAALILSVLRRRHDLAKAAAIAGISLTTSLCFMVMHEIRIAYYLFPTAVYGTATAVFCLIACENARASGTRPNPLSPILKAMAFGAVSIVAAVVPWLLILPVYQPPEMTASFGPRAIVWADLLTGTIHYYLHRQSSVIVFAAEPLQDRIISAVADDGRPQFLIVDSASTKTLADRLRTRMELRPAGVAFDAEVFELRPGSASR
jgi:hypothetical protein